MSGCALINESLWIDSLWLQALILLGPVAVLLLLIWWCER